jgi:hypothetical protein
MFATTEELEITRLLLLEIIPKWSRHVIHALANTSNIPIDFNKIPKDKQRRLLHLLYQVLTHPTFTTTGMYKTSAAFLAAAAMTPWNPDSFSSNLQLQEYLMNCKADTALQGSISSKLNKQETQYLAIITGIYIDEGSLHAEYKQILRSKICKQIKSAPLPEATADPNSMRVLHSFLQKFTRPDPPIDTKDIDKTHPYFTNIHIPLAERRALFWYKLESTPRMGQTSDFWFQIMVLSRILP